MKTKMGPEEWVVEAFPHRCPYCDQIISYDQIGLKRGENRIECPSCKRIFIKVVPNGCEEEETG